MYVVQNGLEDLRESTTSLSTFSFAASAITLANTIANILLNQMVVRRHNMARATVLGFSPLSRCILKKRKIRGKCRFWVKPGRTDLWWQNMIQNRCLEEDWWKKLQNEQKWVHEVGWWTLNCTGIGVNVAFTWYRYNFSYRYENFDPVQLPGWTHTGMSCTGMRFFTGIM